MLVNYEEKGNSLGACPTTKKTRKRHRGKKRSGSESNEMFHQSNSNSQTKSPTEGSLPEQRQLTANVNPAKAAMGRIKSSGKRNRHNSQEMTDSSPQKVSTSNSRPGSSAQQEEIRLYLDKLREIVPQTSTKGKLPQQQLIQHVIDHICDLQHTLDNHPGLQGLDPRVLAAPGGLLSPIQKQQQLLQQQRQQQQNQQQLHQQQQRRQQQNQQQQLSQQQRQQQRNHQQQLHQQQHRQQQQLLQQQNQQQQQRQHLQQQQQQLQQQQQRLCTSSPVYSYNTPYARIPSIAMPLQPSSRPILQVSLTCILRFPKHYCPSSAK